MITDYSRYYGYVFTQLIEGLGRIEVEKLDGGIQGFYLLSKSVPLYIKFSRSRKGPWSFNFHYDHQVRCDELSKQHGSCVVAFVCGTDGIVALDNVQMREVLDEKFDEQESVTIRRKLRHMYSVSGKDGKLDHKVSRDSLILLLNKLLNDEDSELINVSALSAHKEPSLRPQPTKRPDEITEARGPRIFRLFNFSSRRSPRDEIL